MFFLGSGGSGGANGYTYVPPGPVFALNVNGLLNARVATLVFPASTEQAVTLVVAARMWVDATPTDAGSIEIVCDAVAVVDGLGVATLTLTAVPVPDLTRLPVALGGATATVVASAGGFTAQVQRPAGVACSCLVRYWFIADQLP